MLTRNAATVDQAHELAKWVSTAEGAAAWASAFLSNPVGKGGADMTNPDVTTHYRSAFGGAKLAASWWWPGQSAEFVAKRGEYSDKYKAS